MENTTDIWGAFFRTGSVLLFVIALLLLFLYLLKRFSASKLMSPEQGLIKILAVHHFSPREKLVLIDVMDEKMLLGVTSQNIQNLAVLDGKIDTETPAPSSFPLPKNFAQLLKGVGQGKKIHDPLFGNGAAGTTSVDNTDTPSVNSTGTSSGDKTDYPPPLKGVVSKDGPPMENSHGD